MLVPVREPVQVQAKALELELVLELALVPGRELVLARESVPG